MACKARRKTQDTDEPHLSSFPTNIDCLDELLTPRSATMSAYASLPGSFLPPFFAFGTPSSSSENDTADVGDGDGGDTKNTSCVQKNNNNSPITPKEPSCPYSRSSSSGDISPSAFKALALSPQESNELGSTDTTAARTPPSPSDIIIAIRSARVDPVALIKSLTSTGSNIARRTANFIHTAATTESSSSSNNEGAASSQQPGAVGKEEAGERAVDEEVSVFTPGLCLEDTDSDDEYSMYDYSDDFSTPNDDSEDSSHDDKNLLSNNEHTNTSNEDPSAIEFELSITFQGRKYNATRAFPTFVKLRDDLLREFNDGRDQDGEVVVQKGGRRNRRGGVRSKSPINATIEDNESCLLNGSIGNNGMRKSVSKSIPELPRVSPESLGHGGGYALATGVARSGFALLQATAQHYCPEMERWMREVIMQYPCSQSLSSFLWEPLSSSNANWETIGEGTELVGNIDASCTSNEGLAADSNKPPLHTRSKSRSSNSLYKSRFKSSQSMGSLNSIDEGNDIDCDDHSI